MVAMELTIDQLARRAGMTVRNVRAHQTRGLLPPMELRGRTAVYGREHVDRLHAVKQLQARGMSLEGIQRLVRTMPAADSDQLMALAGDELSPYDPENPIVVDDTVLDHIWGDQITPELLERIEKLAHIRRLGDGRYEVRSARLLQAALAMGEVGIPLEFTVELTEQLWDQLRSTASRFVDEILTHASDEEIAAGLFQPDQLRRIRTLAGQATLALLGMAMDEAIEAGVPRA